jgi:hypothetical protein
MTNDEIKQLPSIVDACLDDAILDEVRQDLNEKLDKVCQLAIQALELQPTDMPSWITKEDKEYLSFTTRRANDENILGGKYFKAYSYGVHRAWDRLYEALKKFPDRPCERCLHQERESFCNSCMHHYYSQFIDRGEDDDMDKTEG